MGVKSTLCSCPLSVAEFTFSPLITGRVVMCLFHVVHIPGALGPASKRRYVVRPQDPVPKILNLNPYTLHHGVETAPEATAIPERARQWPFAQSFLKDLINLRSTSQAQQSRSSSIQSSEAPALRSSSRSSHSATCQLLGSSAALWGPGCHDTCSVRRRPQSKLRALLEEWSGGEFFRARRRADCAPR